MPQKVSMLPPNSEVTATMDWIVRNAVPLINIMGLICDIVGAVMVASEVVRQFRGVKYGRSTGFTFGMHVSNSPAQETEEYKRWDVLKYRNMKAGLIFLIGGFLLQGLANVLQLS